MQRSLPSSCSHCCSAAGAAGATGHDAPQTVCAGIAASRFQSVNTAKGPWAFLQQLTAAQADEADASADSYMDGGAAQPAGALLLHGGRQQEQAAQLPAMSLADVTARVQAAAEECVGSDGIEAGGRFAPGAFDSLSAVELSNSLGKVCCSFALLSGFDPDRC